MHDLAEHPHPIADGRIVSYKSADYTVIAYYGTATYLSPMGKQSSAANRDASLDVTVIVHYAIRAQRRIAAYQSEMTDPAALPQANRIRLILTDRRTSH